MEIFRTYVKTDGKVCVDKFKNIKDCRSYDEVKSCDSYAGVLADNIALVDIDTEEQSEILLDIVKKKQLNCRVTKTTHGMHFFFLNNDTYQKCITKGKVACGLTIDVKLGSRNSLSVEKVDGVERPVIYDTCNDYDTVPAFLKVVKTSTDFVNMKDGDGRDSALFAYILNLQSAGLDKSSTIECINLINEYLFKDKMPQSDIDRICRDDAFNAPVFFGDKGQFLFDTFARYMASEHHIIRLNGQLHMYKDGIYVAGVYHIESEMIKHIPNLNYSRRVEVLKYLDVYITESFNKSHEKYIAFNNGILNVYTNEFEDFTPSIVLTNKIPFNYNVDAYHELTDKTLNKLSCNDKNVRALLEEMAGYCMFRKNELGKAFILTGSGSNGKSTYLNMIKTMLGKNNISSLDLSDIKDRFSTILMCNKLANIGDDISDGFIDNTSTFKKVVTGETIGAEQKGMPKFEFNPYAKLIFSANSIPRLGRGRDSTAIIRRLVIIPFNATFKPTDEDYVPFIGEKLKEDNAIEYLIALGIKALKRVLETNQFTTSDKLQSELDEFEEVNNPILGFFKETDKDTIVGHGTKDTYIRYSEYCISAGIAPCAQITFTKQTQNFYNVSVVKKRIGDIVMNVFQ